MSDLLALLSDLARSIAVAALESLRAAIAAACELVRDVAGLPGVWRSMRWEEQR